MFEIIFLSAKLRHKQSTNHDSSELTDLLFRDTTLGQPEWGYRKDEVKMSVEMDGYKWNGSRLLESAEQQSSRKIPRRIKSTGLDSQRTCSL